MEHFGIGDPVARLNAFMAGDVDMMVNLPGKAVKEVEAAAGKEVWSVESGRYTSLCVTKVFLLQTTEILLEQCKCVWIELVLLREN